jgi:hypothetical protein
MKGFRHVCWQDGQLWIGYLEDYADYLTQGESLEDLKEHLRDLFADLSGGCIPAMRRLRKRHLGTRTPIGSELGPTSGGG